jgi:hypothetical protein
MCFIFVQSNTKCERAQWNFALNGLKNMFHVRDFFYGQLGPIVGTVLAQIYVWK